MSSIFSNKLIKDSVFDAVALGKYNISSFVCQIVASMESKSSNDEKCSILQQLESFLAQPDCNELKLKLVNCFPDHSQQSEYSEKFLKLLLKDEPTGSSDLWETFPSDSINDGCGGGGGSIGRDAKLPIAVTIAYDEGYDPFKLTHGEIQDKISQKAEEIQFFTDKLKQLTAELEFLKERFQSFPNTAGDAEYALLLSEYS
jgi:hypothetical protein